MANYCNSAELEFNWLRWLMATKTPELEPLRELGVLWSQPSEYVCDGAQRYPSPTSVGWLHCVALRSPFYFASERGELCRHPEHPVNEHGLTPRSEWLALDSEHECLGLDDPFYVNYELVPELQTAGYIHEVPALQSWQRIIVDVENTCKGVSHKFKMADDDRHDLVQEAITQIIRKLRHGKLVYKPGKAPVFNLLTTTIHRCMYSVLNKTGRARKSSAKLVSDLKAGAVPRQYRSFRIPEIAARVN